MEHGDAVAARGVQNLGGAFRRADDHERLRARDLDLERRPQRACRNDAAVADAAAAVDQKDGEVLDQRRILESVVHDDDAGAGGARQAGAGDAVAGDDGRRKPRQHQRLVADVGRVMKRRIDAHRSGESAAIAAAEKKRPLVHR